MEKVFKVADIRDLEQKVTLGEISYGKMVELMNEKAEQHYSKVKKLNEPAVSNGIEPVREDLVCPNCGSADIYESKNTSACFCNYCRYRWAN